MNLALLAALRLSNKIIGLLAVLIIGASTLVAQDSKVGAALDQPVITLASFNIRAFSDRTRTDAELADIAQLIAPYDLVIIQETRDTIILERLIRMLDSQFGLSFIFSDSPKLKSGGGELYAYVWRTDRITALTQASLVADPGDRFIREPAWAIFQAFGGFDFVVINYHALFGSSVAKRRLELGHLPEAVQAVQELVTQAIPGETDILLAGDFNLSCTDRAFDGLREAGMQPINPGRGTTIADSPYDNLWIFPDRSSEFSGQWGIIKFDETAFDNNDKMASLVVSDHRPLWAQFAASPDDD